METVQYRPNCRGLNDRLICLKGKTVSGAVCERCSGTGYDPFDHIDETGPFPKLNQRESAEMFEFRKDLSRHITDKYLIKIFGTGSTGGVTEITIPKHECPPHIYDNAKVVVRHGKLKTLSKCAYCGFELIF